MKTAIKKHTDQMIKELGGIIHTALIQKIEKKRYLVVTVKAHDQAEYLKQLQLVRQFNRKHHASVKTLGVRRCYVLPTNTVTQEWTSLTSRAALRSLIAGQKFTRPSSQKSPVTDWLLSDKKNGSVVSHMLAQQVDKAPKYQQATS